MTTRKTRPRRSRPPHEPATLAGVLPGGDEMWRQGSTVFVLPAIPDRASPRLREALARRKLTVTTGRCPCGARFRPPRGARGVLRTDVRHDHDCPASDPDLLDELKELRR